MKNKGKKFGGFLTFIIIISIVAAIGLVGWFCYDNYEKYEINKRAEDIIDTFDKNVEEKLTEEELQRKNEEELAKGGNDVKTRRRSARTDYTTRYDDCIVVGTIRIPAINIKYPIMQEQSVEGLKIGVAIAYGPGINQIGNTVILGHNYRNGTLFAKIGKLTKGKSIFIKDESGQEIEYEVYKVFSAQDNDSSFYSAKYEREKRNNFINM